MSSTVLLSAVICPVAMAAMMILMMRGSRRRDDPGAADSAGVVTGSGGGVLYVRNLRNMPIRIWAGGVPHGIGRRGLPRDAIALPAAAIRDPDVAGYLELHWIEEIDATTYHARCTASPGNGSHPRPRPGPSGSRSLGEGER